MTARVCSDHFERVIVIEPEAWALSDAAREGPLTTGTRTVETERGVSYTTATHKVRGYSFQLARQLRRAGSLTAYARLPVPWLPW